jgi:tRNA 2-thiouridine synthesizing protein E
MSNDKPELDDNGFLVGNGRWTQEVAEILVRNEFKLLNTEERGNNTMEPQSMSDDMPELDDEGYLIDTKKWSEEVAEILAQEELPTGLTEDHWTVIAFMRRFYLEWDVCPPIRMIARRTGMSLGRLKELFPDGLTKSACRYAGIPRMAIRPSFMYPR